MSEPILEPGQTVECIRCYVAVVNLQGSPPQPLMGLGVTAVAACSAFRGCFDSLGNPIAPNLDPNKCQRVTITPGWGDEDEPQLVFRAVNPEVEDTAEGGCTT